MSKKEEAKIILEKNKKEILKKLKSILRDGEILTCYIMDEFDSDAVDELWENDTDPIWISGTARKSCEKFIRSISKQLATKVKELKL